MQSWRFAPKTQCRQISYLIAGIPLAEEELLVKQLADSLLGEFPAAMESPLVAAGIFGARARDFYAKGKNVMRLLPTKGYEVVHAEEQAIKAFEQSAHTQSGEPLYFVITLEPCKKRQPRGELPCCKRIVEFAGRYHVEKVIIGTLETKGGGLRFLLENGLRVALLHGPEHETSIAEKCAQDGQRSDPRRALKELRKTRKGLLQVIEADQIDPLNREEHQRFLRMIKGRKHRLEEVFRALTVVEREADPFSRLLESFPHFLYEEDREYFMERLKISRRDPAASLVDLLSLLFRTRVYDALKKDRNHRIEQELRGKEKKNDV